MARTCLVIVALLVALTAWGAMYVAREMNYGFQFTEEQLKEYNKLVNCSSRYRHVHLLSSTWFAPAEDIEFNLETNMAFLSVSDIQARARKLPTRNLLGGFAHYDAEAQDFYLTHTKASKVDGLSIRPEHLNPLGISLLHYQALEPKPSVYLFAVNYVVDATHKNQPSVLIYRHDFLNSATNILSLDYNMKSPVLEEPNDVAGLSPTEFYVTNSHSGPTVATLGSVVLDALGIYTGNVLHCSAAKNSCKKVVDGLRYANSIYLNHNHTLVYVTETVGKALLVYRRDSQTNELSLDETIELGAFLDNINVDSFNNVWVAGTMDSFATLRAILDTTKEFKAAPSIVFRLVPKTHAADEKPSKWNQPQYKSKNYWVEIVYADNGSTITPVSVAAPTRYGEVMLGGLVSDELIMCQLPRNTGK